MATIREIAEKANVSIATVSNILNGKGQASAKTIEKVLLIAEELDYRPNIFAQYLKKKKPSMIGVICEDITVFNTPLIMDGIEAYCEKCGYQTLFSNLRIHQKFNSKFYKSDAYGDIMRDAIDNLLANQVEGLIIIGCHYRTIDCLPDNLPIPMVCVYLDSQNSNIPSIIYDDEEAAFRVTNHLISKGHRSIGIIGGDPRSLHTIRRLKGYQHALFKHQLFYNPDIVFTKDWTMESGFEYAPQLIEKEVTAVFAFNDLIAGGVIEYARQNNIDIPRQLSLVGFDDRECSWSYYPKLTTVAFPLAEMGKNAIKVLLEIKNKRSETIETLLNPPCMLIERDSVADIRENK